jgi:hypothetical protein
MMIKQESLQVFPSLSSTSCIIEFRLPWKGRFQGVPAVEFQRKPWRTTLSSNGRQLVPVQILSVPITTPETEYS